jgi:hypothetical protein
MRLKVLLQLHVCSKAGPKSYNGANAAVPYLIVAIQGISLPSSLLSTEIGSLEAYGGGASKSFLAEEMRKAFPQCSYLCYATPVRPHTQYSLL